MNMLYLKKKLTIYGIIFSIIVIFISGFIVYQYMMDNPDIPLLLPEEGADWIRYRQPVELLSKPGQQITIFSKDYRVDTLPPKVLLSVRAMKNFTVWIDNRMIFQSRAEVPNWKQIVNIDLSEVIRPGNHRLLISVENFNGHPLLLAYSQALHLATNEDWLATKDLKNWSSALYAGTQQFPLDPNDRLIISYKFPRTDRTLLTHLPLYIAIFLLVFFFTFLNSMRHSFYFSRLNFFRYINANYVHWFILSAWVAMSINNLIKLPLYIGMDYPEQLGYIQYIVEHGRIPLANEGWQMFQPPLYYFLSAILYKTFMFFISINCVEMILRIIPIICGALQIELCWQALKTAFPHQNNLKIVGILICGLLPMNTYISQVIGNEPLVGCLSSIAIIMIIRYLQVFPQRSVQAFATIGLMMGLALLTKLTVLPLFVPVLIAVAYMSINNHDDKKNAYYFALKNVLIVLGCAFLVSGWYFIRNWLYLDTFIVNKSCNVEWWQEPGYRTVEQFYFFGKSVFYPIYANVIGFWDSLYSTFWLDGSLSGIASYQFRPPWNYDFLLAGAFFAIVPSFAIMLGLIASFRKPLAPERRIIFFSALCALIYIASLAYRFLTIPMYSVAKATYMISILPCFAILCGAGFRILTKNLFLKCLCYGLIACFAVAAYSAYFVL